MNTNDVGNTADKATGPDAGAVDDLSRSAIATIWRGQKQLRQRVLTVDGSGVPFRNVTGSAFRGAGIARTHQLATGG